MHTSTTYFYTLDQIRTEMNKCKITDTSAIDVVEVAHLIEDAVTLLKTKPLSEISKKDKIKIHEELCRYAEILHRNALITRKHTTTLTMLMLMCLKEKYSFEDEKRRS